VSFLDDLDKATRLFDREMTALNQTRAVNTAQERAQELNEQLQIESINQKEFRQQQFQNAQGLSQELQSLGASVSQQQAAVANFGPGAAKSGVQNLAEAFAVGDEQGKVTAESQIVAQNAAGRDILERTNRFKARQNKFDRISRFAELQIEKGVPVSGTADAIASSIEKNVPKNFQIAAMKEVGAEIKFQEDKGLVNSWYDSQINTSFMARVPWSESKTKLDTANASITTMIASAIKGNPSDPEFERQVAPFLLEASDRDAQLEIKRQGALDFVISKKPASPILRTYRIPLGSLKNPEDVTLKDYEQVKGLKAKQDFLSTLPPKKQIELQNEFLFNEGKKKHGR